MKFAISSKEKLGLDDYLFIVEPDVKQKKASNFQHTRHYIISMITLNSSEVTNVQLRYILHRDQLETLYEKIIVPQFPQIGEISFFDDIISAMRKTKLLHFPRNEIHSFWINLITSIRMAP